MGTQSRVIEMNIGLIAGIVIGCLQGLFTIPVLKLSGSIIENIELQGLMAWLFGFFLFASYLVLGIGLFAAAMAYTNNHIIYQKGWSVGLLVGFGIYVIYIRKKLNSDRH